MEICNLLLDLEDIAYKSKILKATLFAVNEQLYEELGEENRAILDGIAEYVLALDKEIGKLTKKGFTVRKERR